MAKNYIGEDINIDDLLELTDHNIFEYYKRTCHPFGVFYKLAEFKHLESYDSCKQQLKNEIRLHKIKKLKNV
jgi:hypothetical protein